MAYYQKCPVCNGTGLVSYPPGVAGDKGSFSSTSAGPWSCRICLGAGILSISDDVDEARRRLSDSAEIPEPYRMEDE